jgi:hypothetical protein
LALKKFIISYVLIHFKLFLCFHNWITYSSVFEISLYFFSRTLLKTIGFETLQLLAICISTFVENWYFYTLFIHNTYTSWGSQSWLTWLDIIRRTMWKTLSSSAASLFFSLNSNRSWNLSSFKANYSTLAKTQKRQE